MRPLALPVAAAVLAGLAACSNGPAAGARNPPVLAPRPAVVTHAASAAECRPVTVTLRALEADLNQSYGVAKQATFVTDMGSDQQALWADANAPGTPAGLASAILEFRSAGEQYAQDEFSPLKTHKLPAAVRVRQDETRIESALRTIVRYCPALGR